MRLRRLNDEGIRQMGEFLDSFDKNTPAPYLSSILTDIATSEALSVKIEVERKDFPRRFEAAQYLYERLHESGLSHPERDAGLWAWLALFWFDQLCPPRKDGRRDPGERARLIPELSTTWRYYRHLVLGPYLIYKTHHDNPKRAMAVLETPMSAPGEVVAQIASRPQLITCPAVVGAATKLYWLPAGGLRKGSGEKEKPGSSRRLADVLMQFDRTFDLHSTTINGLVSLLPKEFQQFVK